MLSKSITVPKAWETMLDAKKRIRDKLHLPKMFKSFALKHHESNDYELIGSSVWIKTQNHVVYIRQLENNGTAVEITTIKEGIINTLGECHADGDDFTLKARSV
jgi:hypothetical protein